MPRLRGNPASKAGGFPFLAATAALFLGASLFLASCASTSPRTLAQQWFDIGNSWLDKKEWKKAGEAYSKALAMDPSFAGASLNFVRALTEAGEYDTALKLLDSLEARDPGNLRVARAKGYALFKKGNLKDSLEVYKAVLDRDSYDADTLYNVAVLELASGDTKSAIKDLLTLQKNTPEDASVLSVLGKAYEANGDSDGMIATYEKLKTLGKADAVAYEKLGLYYNDQKRFSDAIDAFAAAVKADAKRSLSWFNLARLRLVVASDSERGLAALKSALDAGFSDKKAAKALLDEPDLPERQKVYDMLKAKDLAE